ncbi:hypothetical protein [Bacillus cereus]|uniref:hypothetical protein n=1 Tax=Bacillus cereus TaxID=1396 RepID=UPI000943CEA4|nr:hypothetical protein [Bacillus cereus]
MIRAVTSDHILFKECIESFRPENRNFDSETEQVIGYLLLDFRLNKELKFEHFIIQPATEVRFENDIRYASFIAPVILPKWKEISGREHLFLIALSTVMSFIFRRAITAPRDQFFSWSKEIDVTKYAMHHPILTAGPGAHKIVIPEERLEELYRELQEFVKLLCDVIPYKKYTEVMQSIRLVQLAFLNMREDFALSYYLLISSIEPFARKAIKRKRVVSKHPLEEKWKKYAEENEDISQLFEEYSRLSGENKQLVKRFVEFVLEYCPPNQWNQLEHPSEWDLAAIPEDIRPNFNWIIEDHWDEIYPESIPEKEIRDILSGAYKHRSQYTHEGKNPPHSSPSDGVLKYFEKQMIVSEEPFKIIELTYPTFNLMSFIAKKSIQNYLLKVYC